KLIQRQSAYLFSGSVSVISVQAVVGIAVVNASVEVKKSFQHSYKFTLRNSSVEYRRKVPTERSP
ncbi:AAEL006767-PA, partial [Aedes aegypti]